MPLWCEVRRLFAFCRIQKAWIPLADPDLQIREGPGHPDPKIRKGGGGLQKLLFGPLGLGLV